MKKNFKRWLALLLAVALIATSGVYSSHSWLRANEDQNTAATSTEEASVTTYAEEGENTPTENTGENLTQGEVQQTQEVTIDQNAGDVQQEQITSEDTTVANQEQQAVTEPSTAEENTQGQEETKYEVVINQPAIDGGKIESWTADTEKQEVVYDANHQFKTEIKEHTLFYFSVKAPENYEIEKVTDQNGTEIQSESVNENVYTYKTDVSETKTFTITYKDVQKAEDSKTEESAIAVQSEQNSRAVRTVGSTCTITPTLQNVEVAYVYFKDAAGAQNNPLTTVSGSSSFTDFASSQHAGYIVFFVKPSEGYLLTGLNSNGMGDLYSLSGSSFGNINGYPGMQTVAARAKAAGYVACFGYSRGASTTADVNATFTVLGVTPSIQVSATCNKTTDIIPGDALQFNVKITPETVVNGKTLTVDGVKVTLLTINGWAYTVQSMVSNNDGTYTATIDYTATTADCASGKIKFDVAASVDYSYVLGVKDSTGVSGSANTTATTTNSASTTCTIAGKVGYGYSYTYLNADQIPESSYPEEISASTLPKGSTASYKGSDITVASAPAQVVVDEANNGIWVFDGWYLDNKKVSAEKVKQKDEFMGFEGRWTFMNMSVAGYEGTYDGQRHSVSGETVNGATVGTNWTYQYRTNENEPWSDEKPMFKNVGKHTVYVKASSDNYGDLTASADVVIGKRMITVTTGSSEQNYNGNALTNSTITVTGYVSGEITGQETTGSQTEVGESKNTYELTWSKDAKESNYDISETLGTLTVNPAVATLTVTDYVGTYDAKEHSISGETVSNTVDDATWTYQYSRTGEDDTWSSEKPMFKDATEGAQSVYVKASAANYADIVEEATVTINKVQLEVTTGSASKTYDGDALTNDEITIANVVNKEVTGRTTGSQTEVGESKNTYELTWADGVNRNNYETTVKETLGTLAVTASEGKASLAVEGYNGVYDGEDHSVSKETVTGAKEGTKWTYQYRTSETEEWSNTKPEFKDAGTYTVYVKASNKNYKDLTVKADVVITKATIVVTTEGASRSYDGTALTNDKMTVTGVVKDEVTASKTTGSQTEVGTSENTYKLTWKDGVNKKNYNEIEEHLGTLEVTKAAATLTVDPYHDEYDAKQHSVANEIITNAVEGTSWTYQYRTNENDTWSDTKPMFKDAGVYTVYVKASNKNYSDTYAKADVTIDKKTLKVTTGSDEKPYDGTPLTNTTIQVEGVVNQEITGRTTGSQTAVGESKNTYEFIWNNGANQNNYNSIVEENLGTLKVTANDSTGVKLQVTGYEGIYDGQNHSITNETVTGAVKGTEWTYQYRTGEDDNWSDAKPTFKNVGTYTVYVKASNLNYADVETTATVKIKKATIQVETGSASRAYDGTALTSDVITVTGYVSGEITGYRTTGSQTEVGKSDNRYELMWADGVDKGNYIIKDKLGELEITKNAESASLAVKGYAGTYDAENHSVSEETVSGAAEGTIWTYQYRTSEDAAWSDEKPMFKDAGSYTVYVKASNTNYKDLEASADVIIAKKTLTITTGSDEKVYDGKALTSQQISVDGIVKDEITAYKTVGSQTEVGESDNSYELTWKDGVNKENYTVVENIGTLAVTAAEIVIPENPESARFTLNDPTDKVYNGQSQKWTPNVTDATTGKVLKENIDYILRYSTDDFTNVGNGIEVTIVGQGNYSGTVYRTYRITPISIQLTAASASKVYDGTDLSANKYELADGAFVTGEGLESVSVKGTQRYVGESQNVISGHKLKANTKSENYTIEYVPGKLTVTDGTAENPVNSDKVVVKTHGNEKTSYKLGDEITFKIRVTNIYNEAKTITIVEQEGVTITGASQFENVKPWETVETTSTYIVTEADILAGGTFTNHVQAQFTGGKTFENTDDVIIDTPVSHITVNKTTTSTPKNGTTYTLGESIIYQITATNDGNMTINNVVVTDELTNDSWKVETLAPGQTSEVFRAEHVVTEADVKAGRVLNQATATGISVDPKNPEPGVTPGEKEDPVETSAPSLLVIKSADEGTYKLGETVSYSIRVVNNGNVTISNIQIADDLTGDNWNVDSLKPNEEKTFTAEYVITEADIKNGSIHNIATAKGTDPDGKTIDADGEKTITPDVAKADFTLKKSVVDPKEEYQVGDTISYKVEVTNTGNITLNQIEVTDQMQNAAGSAIFLDGDGYWSEDSIAVISTLAPGQTVVLNCEYTVLRADAGALLSNAVVATSDETKEEQPKQDETDPTPVDRAYQLVIHYVDEAGNTLAEDYSGSFVEGEQFTVESPEVEGYTPDYASISSDENGMPRENLEFTVTYKADETPETPENPTTPNNPLRPDTPNVVTPPATQNVPTTITPAATPTNSASIDAVIAQDENGDYQLIPIQDGETPLANKKLDNHECCVLHFLLMLLAMIVLLFYTRSMKKRQARIFELREELETEKVKRGMLEENEENVE